ncbi:YicC/YloC family endoribonuclease [Pseudorhodobacter sp. MZDSW-24AT]|uniref:YicC/YloC family endoribonuclease n=1 Tax=Pseudorhodobacter sp. MZDSW-24AT TaxID=2052957 RepID=UPI000C1E9BC8|nr:YicC/YloC family endoribonuclease [Pseudorhodobacter sp. MZDSW-24AT]PJF10989.1 YicC family protein [Pseudorhodobacter sp. MZDSW-24AT]
MTVSMTGFAARKGQALGFVWAWDIRSVNGKGLDLRLRLPDWIDGLEPALRAELQKALSRGNVSLSLKVAREAAGAESGVQVKPHALAAVLAALQEVEAAALQAGVTLAQATAADVLAVRGVLDAAAVEEESAPLRAALLADLPALLAAFAEMRAAEGLALQGVIAGQLDQIAALTRSAKAEAEARRDTAAATLRAALARVLDHAEGVDAGRVAQELAMIAVKQDVTEELDRLEAHVAAARALLAETGPVGRKFDFLMQEFMREANTLCSKAQALALTRIGLDLKTVIDQMREQVQNVE